MTIKAGIKITTDLRPLTKAKARLKGLGEQRLNELDGKLAELAKDGREELRWLIGHSYNEADRNNPDTHGGSVPAGQGSDPRKKSGALINKATVRRRRYKNSVTYDIGWLSNEPGWAPFQELGTSTGVRAMEALPQVAMYLAAKLKKLTRSKKATTEADFNEPGFF